MPAEISLWTRCVRELQAELPEQQFNTWIRPLQAVYDGRVLRLLAPNRFVVDWLNQHYLERILGLVGADADVIVEVGSRDVPVSAVVSRPRPAARKTSAPPIASRLGPNFTFDQFVEGKSNQLARAAASQVSENPGKSYSRSISNGWITYRGDGGGNYIAVPPGFICFSQGKSLQVKLLT